MKQINDLLIAEAPRGTERHEIIRGNMLISHCGRVATAASLPEGKWKIICAFSKMSKRHFEAARKAAKGEITIPDELGRYMMYTSELLFIKRIK